MQSSARVLVVAHRTAATPPLLDAVRRRAAEGPATFTLLVPHPSHGLHRLVDPEDGGDDEARAVIDLAVPLLEEACGGPVEAIVGDSSPVDAVHDAVNTHGFDEIIISMLSPRVSRWLHMDVPSRLRVLGLPVTTVVAKGARSERPVPAA
jgi:hypothetical protein